LTACCRRARLYTFAALHTHSELTEKMNKILARRLTKVEAKHAVTEASDLGWAAFPRDIAVVNNSGKEFRFERSSFDGEKAVYENRLGFKVTVFND
jgi:hypothetical protein